MVFFLVGLQNIETDIFEAAEVDGASQARKFFAITLPLLVPVILFSAVTSTSGTMQLFDEPNILTWEGGPSNATMTAALYIYRQAFILNSDFGYASALSYVIVAISGHPRLHPDPAAGKEGLDGGHQVRLLRPVRPLDPPAHRRIPLRLPVLLDGGRHHAEPERRRARRHRARAESSA